VLLCVSLLAMAADAQPCAPPGSAAPSAPARPAQASPPTAQLDPSLCAQLEAIAQRLARIEAQQKADADKKPAVVTVLSNRYVELVLVSVAAFFAGLKLR